MSEEAFYLDPHFWVAVSFVVFLLVVIRPVGRVVIRSLDVRSAQIAEELAQAKRLRQEAEALLDLYRVKQSQSLKEAEAILKNTEEDAKRMASQAEADLKTALDKRMKLSVEKIAQAETKALQDVQSHVIDIAVAAARAIITEHLSRGGSAELVKQAALELERKLH